MRIVTRARNNNLYLVDTFNVTGKVIGYKAYHTTTGSLKNAKSIAQQELKLGASHVNISKIVCHCFSK